MKKIIILNSYEYYGGTLVLSTLCRLLSQRGYDTRLFIIHQYPEQGMNQYKYLYKNWLKYNITYGIKKIIYAIIKNTKLANNRRFKAISINHTYNCKIQYLPFFNKKDTIVIYPEIAFGNLLKAENIVRWLLYHYKYENIPNAYSPNDLFICYREKFNSWKLNPECKKVQINDFNSKLYFQYNWGERKEKCFLIRKGHYRNDLPKEFDGEVIDFHTPERDIVRIFNEYKYCYIYDTQTFYTKIAAICGCIPIVVVEKGKKRSDYLTQTDNPGYGIAYGNTPEEIEYAISTRDLLLSSLDYTAANNRNIDKLIDYIEKHFLCKIEKVDENTRNQ